MEHHYEYSTITRKPLKFAVVPQTRQQISVASEPKFTILWGHVVDIAVWQVFFNCRYVPCCEDIALQSCAMVPAIFCVLPISSELRVQHISDLHS